MLHIPRTNYHLLLNKSRNATVIKNIIIGKTCVVATKEKKKNYEKLLAYDEML